YDFGFRVGLGYIFPDSGNDVQVNWTHFNHSDDATAVQSNVRGHNVTYHTDVNFKFNAVDLDVGQFVNIGTRLQTRLFMGLRGAELNMDRTRTKTVDNKPNAPILKVSSSKFSGIGPRIGIDTSYHVGERFGIVGHFATALLVGKVDSNAS